MKSKTYIPEDTNPIPENYKFSKPVSIERHAFMIKKDGTRNESGI
jgi:hypothetical protein